MNEEGKKKIDMKSERQKDIERKNNRTDKRIEDNQWRKKK